MRIEHRDYQVKAIESLRALLRKGLKRLVLVSPTGSGKTIMAGVMVAGALGKGKKILFIVHRQILVDQTLARFAAMGMRAAVIMGNDKRTDASAQVQVATIQTLSRRVLPQVDLIIYDECHHATANSSKDVLEKYPDATIIGLTATPWRTDKLGLQDLFQTSVLAAEPTELVEKKALSPCEGIGFDAPDLHEVKTTAGDYNLGQLELACNTEVLVNHVVTEYIKRASGRRAIVFPVSIKHSQSLIDQFVLSGIPARHIDCNTPKDDREHALSAFERGDVLILSSVGVLTEGFDAPAAEVCILARPTKSLPLYIQMVGRVRRYLPGKMAFILDHSGNVMRHGLPDAPRSYEIGSTPERVMAIHTCPFCEYFYSALTPDGKCPKCKEQIQDNVCPKCGKEECVCPAVTVGNKKEKLIVNGVALTFAQIEAIRQKRKDGNMDRSLSNEQIVKAAHATREQKLSEYKRLILLGKMKGYKKGWAYYEYRKTFSVDPPFSHASIDAAAPALRPFF